jgi:hypothetical protein
VPSAVCKRYFSNIMIAVVTPTYNQSPGSLGSGTPSTDAESEHMPPRIIRDESISSPYVDDLDSELHIYSSYPSHSSSFQKMIQMKNFVTQFPFENVRHSFITSIGSVSCLISGSRNCNIPSPQCLALRPTSCVSESIIATPRLLRPWVTRPALRGN